jgi:hypothetical protein
MKPLVCLYDAGLGLVFPWPSGVMYANQACGHACLQPEVEGVFVPFDAEESWARLSEYFEGPKYLGSGAMRGLDVEDADFIDRILRDLRQGQVITDRVRLVESHEAWVHVIVEAEMDGSLFTGLGPYPRPAILTWPNSD